MNWSISAVLGLFIVLSNPAHSTACIASSTSTGTGAADGSNCTITGTQSTIQLNFIGGFNSATGLSAVGGNGGTTLGAQRMLSFIKAIEIISDQVDSTQTIIVDANFTALDCDATSATLGSAGPSVSLYNPTAPGGMANNTWYPIGLYNHLANSDNFLPGADTYTGNSTGSDINSKFNSNIGTTGCLQSSSGWYYGFDETPSASYIGFTTVLLHEITHGLGFTSLVSPQTGAKSSGFDDVFSNNLYDETLGAWPAMTDAQRADSVVSVTGLLWAGSNVNTQAVGLLTDGFNDVDSDGNFESGDKVEMYAPCATSGNAQYDYVSGDCLYEGGSSVSHFSTDASPNELMEPQYTQYTDSLGLALYLLKDIGWSVSSPLNNSPSWIIIPVQDFVIGDAASINLNSYATDADGDSLSYSGCAAEPICSISGNTLTIITGSAGTASVTVIADDGNSGITNSSSFTINVLATPTIDAGANTLQPNDTTNIDSNAFNIDVSDVADSFTYNLDFSGSSADSLLSLSGDTLTIGMPTSGVFAGTYTLTVTNPNTGTTYDYTLTRTPRLTFSATKLLEETAIQTLKIEGGAAGTTYYPVPDKTELKLFQNNSEITNATATDDPDNFNPATITLNVGEIVSSTDVEITATSTYDPATSTGISLEPKITHTITVQDSNSDMIANSTIELDMTVLSAFNIPQTYTTNSDGQATIVMPEDTNNYSAQVQFTGYTSKTMTLNSNTTEQTITLNELSNSVQVVVISSGSSGGGIGIPFLLFLSLFGLSPLIHTLTNRK